MPNNKHVLDPRRDGQEISRDGSLCPNNKPSEQQDGFEDSQFFAENPDFVSADLIVYYLGGGI